MVVKVVGDSMGEGTSDGTGEGTGLGTGVAPPVFQIQRIRQGMSGGVMGCQ